MMEMQLMHTMIMVIWRWWLWVRISVITFEGIQFTSLWQFGTIPFMHSHKLEINTVPASSVTLTLICGNKKNIFSHFNAMTCETVDDSWPNRVTLGELYNMARSHAVYVALWRDHKPQDIPNIQLTWDITFHGYCYTANINDRGRLFTKR